MSRSRRRGGVSSGFANLRDSVRRRLFDPYAEPAVVDPRVVVAQLIPLRFGEPYINSAISQSDSGPSQGKVENLQLQLFDIGTVIDYAIQNSSEKRELTANELAPPKKYAASDSGVNSTAAHLLMKTKEITFWDSGILSKISKSPKWFPSELSERLKRKSSKVSFSAKRVRFADSSTVLRDDLTNGALPDQYMLEVADRNEDDDGENTIREEAVDAANQVEEKDSEDERWNGDPAARENGEEDGEEGQVGEDEGDDYCETYFDNGEGDIDDFNVQMYEVDDDPDGGSFFD